MKTLRRFLEREKPAILTFVIFLIVGTVYIYLAYGGTLEEYPLDLAVAAAETNPARRESIVKHATTLTATVVDFEYYDIFGLRISPVEDPDRYVRVYLSKHAVEKLSIGDVIVVRGRMRCLNPDRDDFGIVVGESSGWPYMLKARLVEINPVGKEPQTFASWWKEIKVYACFVGAMLIATVVLCLVATAIVILLTDVRRGVAGMNDIKRTLKEAEKIVKSMHGESNR